MFSIGRAVFQEFHLFSEQEQLQKHATLDKNPYCVYGTLNMGCHAGHFIGETRAIFSLVTRSSNYLEDYWPCANGLSAVNAIGTQLRDPINSGLTRWCVVLAKIYGRRRRTREEYHE